MFQSADPVVLRKTLEHYPVPMFAAQRETPKQPFYLICLNAAHTRATGVTTEQVAGVRPTDLLGEVEGAEVEAHYANCADSGVVVNYRETLHFAGRPTRWETTLLPVMTNSGAERVVGTALTLGMPTQSRDVSDAEYYAAQAQMQFAHIGQFLEMLQNRPDLPHDLQTGAMMIEGLNRSLDHLLQDLRLAVQDKLPARVDTRAKLTVVR